jgi:hypothetical protein
MRRILILLLVLIGLKLQAQDTTCTYFKGKEVYEFDYQMDTILYWEEQTTKFYDIEVKYGNVLCLDLSDDKPRVRKVITTFFDGTFREDILDSKDDVYYSPRGTVKVSVGKPRWTIKL